MKRGGSGYVYGIGGEVWWTDCDDRVKGGDQTVVGRQFKFTEGNRNDGIQRNEFQAPLHS